MGASLGICAGEYCAASENVATEGYPCPKLARNRRLLKDVGKFQRPVPSAWEEVGTFFKIRNVVIHTAGFAAGSKYEKAIEGFCSGRTDIRLSYGTLEIEPEFFEFVINMFVAFVEQLESESAALCERTRRLEGS